jgi:hypothetical protein
MGYLEVATFQHGLPEGTACGLEVQTSTEEADFRSSQATGERRISPNDPKTIVWEHHKKSSSSLCKGTLDTWGAAPNPVLAGGQPVISDRKAKGYLRFRCQGSPASPPMNELRSPLTSNQR